MLIIGLTGKTGAGKSTISKLFENYGAFVIDADKLSRQAVEIEEVKTQLENAFGKDIYENNTLNRKLLASRAFKDDIGVCKLNEIVHPAVDRLIVEQIEQCSNSFVIIDAAALLESPSVHRCNKIIVVMADEQTRKQRIIQRDGIDENQAQLRINAQKPDLFYLSKADFIINNNGEDLNEQIQKIIKQIQQN